MSENENDIIAQRRAQLDTLREQGNAFPNDFRRDALASDLIEHHDGKDRDTLESEGVRVKVAGRMMSRRVMGKASFAHLQDMSGRIQLYLKSDNLPEGRYAEFKQWDLGDILGAEGTLFKTKTGELSVLIDNVHLLTKSLRPLPEKFHGLTDQEIRYRQRYLDLITNEDTRRTFKIRSVIIDYIRQYLIKEGFIEVETPMMHVIPGGATARPFKTHHNTLDMPLYLRIAPELYLKRLIVGGIEKVFEVNRSFRNEGLSTQHNPEFTMLEFYQAYADYQDVMNLTEEMLRTLVQTVTGSTKVTYQGEEYDLGQPFARMTVKESVLHFNHDLQPADIDSLESLQGVAKVLGIHIEDNYGPGKVLIEIFEKTVETKLMSPTFITAYPTEVSPLARRNDNDPTVTDRFEFFVGGREIANGFSELNDPDDQAERFRMQMKDKDTGDDEAMQYDADYITTLEYGMPPTAGEGIGIDRLVMFLTDSASIRDVILFPHMRPK
jgi:lysyl-tRNA synthetase class 2